MFHWDNPTFKKNTLHFNFNRKIGSGYVLPLSVLTSPNFFQQDSQQVSSLQYVCAKGGQVGYNKARSVKKGRSSTFVAKMARKKHACTCCWFAIGSDRRGRQPIEKERLRKMRQQQGKLAGFFRELVNARVLRRFVEKLHAYYPAVI